MEGVRQRRQQDWNVCLKVGSVVRRFVALALSRCCGCHSLRTMPHSPIRTAAPNQSSIDFGTCNVLQLATNGICHISTEFPFAWVFAGALLATHMHVFIFIFLFVFIFIFHCHLTHLRQPGREQERLVSPTDCDLNSPSELFRSDDLIFLRLYLCFSLPPSLSLYLSENASTK